MNTFENVCSLDDLSRILNVPKRKLTYLLYVKKIENLYSSFGIPKKNGGSRQINSPQSDLKSVQKNIANLLSNQQKIFWMENNVSPSISHAFVKGKNIVTNAEIHLRKKYVLNVDLEDFFGTFHFGRVAGFFEKNKLFLFPRKIAIILAQLTCYNGKLPQGAPSSPVITNLICNILDMQLIELARQFHLDYSRYADDLTFSTNDIKLFDSFNYFLELLEVIVKKNGFKINQVKTRLQYKNSRQVVTGLVVNQKISIPNEYYRHTRAMADQLYRNETFYIGDIKGNLNQLEGRFSYINYIDKINNKLNGKKKFQLNGREKQYQLFLFYKYLYYNNHPVIITEGKTDIVYIKSALKKHYLDYPLLVSKNVNGKFDFNISFLKKTNRLSYFLDITPDGADSFCKILDFYFDSKEKKRINYSKILASKKCFPKQPTIILFDNEIANSNKPLAKFCLEVKNKIKKNINDSLRTNNYYNIKSNLFVLTHPLVSGCNENEIEDLFDQSTLSKVIDGKIFEKNEKHFNIDQNYSKNIFADYISQNYKTINFDGFKPLLDDLNEIVSQYNNTSTPKYR